MPVLVVDAGADQNSVRVNVEQRCGMYAVDRPVMRGGENMGFQSAPEKPCDGLPALHFGVSGDEIRKSAWAAPGDFEDNAAVVGGAHIVRVRGEQFKVEIGGEPGESTIREPVEPNGDPSQGMGRSASRLLFTVD